MVTRKASLLAGFVTPKHLAIKLERNKVGSIEQIDVKNITRAHEAYKVI